MADAFASYAKATSDPADRHFAIVPSDGADLTTRPRAVYCQAAGTIVIRDEAGVDLPCAMSLGQMLPFRGVRVLATGTFYGWL